MARQVRSEVTRRRILDAAIDVFGEVGYPAAGWGTIVERTGMTKGALYHHFDAKEPLASAIIEQGSATLLGAFRSVCGSASPAFENMIHGTFAVASILSTDKMASGAEQLAAALGGFDEAASRFYDKLGGGNDCRGQPRDQRRRPTRGSRPGNGEQVDRWLHVRNAVVSQRDIR